jgi:hypothetical protein
MTSMTITTPTTTCPSWCNTRHDLSLDLDIVHVHAVMAQDIAAGGRMNVCVERIDGQPATVWVETYDVLTVDEALELATALTAAAAFAAEVTR